MYQILLEGRQIKRNQVTGMHIMAGLLLLVMGLITWMVPNAVKQQQFDFLNWTGLAYALFGLFIIIVCIFFNKKIIQTNANFVLRITEIIALALILSYSLFQKWYLPAAYSGAALIGIALAYYWEKKGKQKKLATFNDNGVEVPGLGRKSKIAWQDLTRVLLRHNILTIDCKDNKLFQLVVAPENRATVNKEEFENYCKANIQAKEHLYKADW